MEAKAWELSPGSVACAEGGANEQWSMDFVSVSLADSRRFRALTVIDKFTREAVLIEADFSLTGKKVAWALERLSKHRSMPQAITADNGAELAGRDLDAWAYWKRVKLDFIRPGKPMENGVAKILNLHLNCEKENPYLVITGQLHVVFPAHAPTLPTCEWDPAYFHNLEERCSEILRPGAIGQVQEKLHGVYQHTKLRASMSIAVDEDIIPPFTLSP